MGRKYELRAVRPEDRADDWYGIKFAELEDALKFARRFNSLAKSGACPTCEVVDIRTGEVVS